MKKITEAFARTFADQWIAAWNAHDLERIMEHYSEDFTIESRIALQLQPESRGRITGKDAVRQYWAKGLAANKKLAFALTDVLTGINGLTLCYVNVSNTVRAAEVMLFNKESKVYRSFVHHSKL